MAYFHEEWQFDWGGALLVYAKRTNHTTERIDLVPIHCIESRP